MRNYRKLLETRLETRIKADNDPAFRLEVLKKCREDDLYWFDNFAWTYDPRREVSEVPLILYDGRQIEYLNFLSGLIKNPRDAFVDKPRDVGATVITMNFLLKHLLFDPFFNARVGSRKESYVDKRGDPDTLFAKLDFTFARLPRWMVPEGFKEGVDRTTMKLGRPDNSNTITGESSNPSFARGGRQTIVLFDEIGFWEYGQSAWQSAGDVTNTRLAMTTPPETGKASFAYRLKSGENGSLELFEFNHNDIPWKDKDWIEAQKLRRSEEEFEREVLKSYTANIKGAYYQKIMQKVEQEGRIGFVPHDPKLNVGTFWDLGIGDYMAIIFYQVLGKEIRIIDYYQTYGEGMSHYAKVLQEKPYVYDSHNFPHDAEVKEIGTGKTRVEVARSLGITPIKIVPKLGVDEGIEAVRNILPRCFFDKSKCALLIDALNLYRSSYDEKNKIFKATPVHDEYSHAADAFRYLAVGFKDVINKTPHKREQIKRYRNPLTGI